MMNDKQKLNQILAKLDDGSEIGAQIEKVRLNNPMDSLRTTLFNFFTKRLEKVEEQEKFQKAIEQKLIAKLEDDKLSIGQLMSLYNMLNAEDTLKTESIFNLAKARETAVVPLNKQNSENPQDNYEILDPAKRAAIEELKEYISELRAKDKEDVVKELTEEK